MISVIVPVYNVQQYLRQSLDSLYRLNYNSRIEVILVNDGSTDNSLEICEEYSNNYPGTILIDKTNGGLSNARNAGIKCASGDYCYFLDSDDWLGPDAIRLLYDYAIANSCDIVQGGFYYAYDAYLLFDNRWYETGSSPFVLTREEAMIELLKQHYIKNFAWNKLYKTEIVKRHPFREGVFFEDSFWQHLIINESTRYGVVPMPLYYYRQRKTGISGCFSLKQLDLLKGMEERLSFIQNAYCDMTNVCASEFWKQSFDLYHEASKSKDEHIVSMFTHFWDEINIKYCNLFDEAMKHNVLYRINKHSRLLTELYLMLYKAYNRLFSKDLKIVDYNEDMDL